MKTWLITLKLFLFMTILTGMIYPLLVTLLAQVIFPVKANGSLVEYKGKPAGSEWIAQSFDSSAYFMSRPSAVSHNPLPSGGSNLGLNSRALFEKVNERRKSFRTHNHLPVNAEIPSEMLFASSSGLDPHISPKTAFLQVERICKSREFSDAQRQKLLRLIDDFTEPRQFLILGEERVNVLLLNLAIDTIHE